MPFPSRPPGGAPGNAARKSQAHTRWVATQDELIFEMFKTFGLPSSDGLLVQLPNYPAEPPNWVVEKGGWLAGAGAEGDDGQSFPHQDPSETSGTTAGSCCWMLSGRR